MTNFGRMRVVEHPSSEKNAKQISDFRKNIVYSVNISAQTDDKILAFFFRRSAVKNYAN